MGAIQANVAYDAGATGSGVLVAIIDNGFDPNNVDLINKLHPNSQDVVAGQTGLIENPDSGSHGTGTSGVAAGEKNDIGTHGVAYDSQILALAAESDVQVAASCAEIRCSILDDDIATAIDIAIANGAKVISMSLGGPTPNANLQAALARAAAAGIVIVIAAGNSSFDDPYAFPQFGLDPSVFGSIIVAGGANTTLDDLFFTGNPRPDGGLSGSNAAGVAQDIYVVAPAQNILVAISSSHPNVNDFTTFAPLTGTSFAAPHIAGFAALLFQAFPNLTGKEVVEIILSTADDWGEVGVDARFGHGFINIATAFQPLGSLSFTTSFDGTISDADLLFDDTGFGFGPAFGDAFLNIDLFREVLVLDDYDRSFTIDLTNRFVGLTRPGANLENFLHSDYGNHNYNIPLSKDQNLFFGIRSFDPSQDARYYSRYYRSPIPLAGFGRGQDQRIHELGFLKFDSMVGQNTSFSFVTGLAPDTIITSNNYQVSQRFDFVTRRKAGNSYFSQMRGITSTGITWHASTKTKVAFVTSYGKYKGGFNPFSDVLPQLEGKAFSALLGINRELGRFKVNAVFGALFEQNAILGSLSSGALNSAPRAQTYFATLGSSVDLGKGFSFTGSYQKGITTVQGNPASMVTGFSNLTSSSFQAYLVKDGLISKADRIGLYIGQPLHIDSGNVSLRLPAGRDYDADRILFTSAQAGVSPSGREIDYELYYLVPTKLGFSLGVNLFYQQDAGHFQGNDIFGATVRLKLSLY
ncbi:MAG: S8 family serine peptidase [Proteobacteria bacterium]|nr:S8 family serine peptidase [Pseudomonadota bacterium]